MQTSLAIASLALFSFLPLSTGSQPASKSPSALQEGMEQEKSPLAETMGVLKRGQRSLKKGIREMDANQADILKTLRAMEQAAMQALDLSPPTPEGLSEAEIVLHRVKYRIQMAKLFETLLEMERATLEHENSKLAELYKTLTAGKKSGHRQFKED